MPDPPVQEHVGQNGDVLYLLFVLSTAPGQQCLQATKISGFNALSFSPSPSPLSLSLSLSLSLHLFLLLCVNYVYMYMYMYVQFRQWCSHQVSSAQQLLVVSARLAESASSLQSVQTPW